MAEKYLLVYCKVTNKKNYTKTALIKRLTSANKNSNIETKTLKRSIISHNFEYLISEFKSGDNNNASLLNYMP